MGSVDVSTLLLIILDFAAKRLVSLEPSRFSRLRGIVLRYL